MIKIRQNIFETNSSSSHSLVYKVNSCTGELAESKLNHDIQLYDFYKDDPKNGILAIHFGDYGWVGDPCDDFRSKLSYLMTQTVHGFGMTYYGNQYDESGKKIEGANEIKILTQDQWDDVIDNYVLKDPNVIRILDFIKEKCPNIKGFKFYWYNTEHDWDLEEDYKRYYDLDYNAKIDYKLTDKFFHDYMSEYGGEKYLIGFGGVDHQSAGLVYGIDYLDKYLFDNNFKVIITNDNR